MTLVLCTCEQLNVWRASSTDQCIWLLCTTAQYGDRFSNSPCTRYSSCLIATLPRRERPPAHTKRRLCVPNACLVVGRTAHAARHDQHLRHHQIHQQPSTLVEACLLVVVGIAHAQRRGALGVAQGQQLHSGWQLGPVNALHRREPNPFAAPSAEQGSWCPSVTTCTTGQLRPTGLT